MKVAITQGNDKKLSPSQINIVIDVIRAFTVAHYAFIRGAKEILLVKSVNEGFKYKDKYPHYLLTGEVKGLLIDGFDLDNSPYNISRASVAGKTLIQKTTNGVRATLNSLAAEHVFVTGYSNARTTASYVRTLYGSQGRKGKINIIASHPTGDDDLACAEYMKSIIEGSNDLVTDDVERRILRSHVAEKFFDENKPEFNRNDILYCVKDVKSNFVMKVNTSGEIPKIERILL